jgi:hypothetical protein
VETQALNFLKGEKAMSNFTASVYLNWGHPLRIFTGAAEPGQSVEEIPFYVSVRDFSKNVGSSTIKKWGSALMPYPGLIRINNNILTNKQEPHYHCTAVPFTEIRKLVNNTDMHPGNKERANAIIKWLEPIYKSYAETIVKPIETGIKALTPKFSDIAANEQNSGLKTAIEPIEITVAGVSDNEQKKAEYRKLRESGMTATEALTEVLGKPQKQRDTCESIVRAACDSIVPVHEQEKSEDNNIQGQSPVGFTVDDVAKRLYELKHENEGLKAEVEKLKKDLEDYRTIRDMFLSIGGD